MSMARKKKRGPTLEDKYLGPEPNYGPHNNVGEGEERLKEYHRGASWFYYYENRKKAHNAILHYAKHDLKLTNKELVNLNKNPVWKINQKNYKPIAMYQAGWVGAPLDLEAVNQRLRDLVKKGEKIKLQKLKESPPKPVITPQERTRKKVIETIYMDWDSTIVEGWFDEDYTQKFSAYNRFRGYGLKSNSINIFKALLEQEYNNIQEAYNRTCEQCVEAYSHITKGNKRKILKQFEDVFADLEKLRTSFKSARKPRAHKPKTSDKQVERLQYMEESIDDKLVSINPVLIPRSHKLFVYNTKQRRLFEYKTESAHGFEVSGTTIKNFDDESRVALLRKPEEILPQILNKTEKQIEKVWSNITTKINKPTGRINSDCILLRVI
jgi:acetone carboxylase gamma subunit